MSFPFEDLVSFFLHFPVNGEHYGAREELGEENRKIVYDSTGSSKQQDLVLTKPNIVVSLID